VTSPSRAKAGVLIALSAGLIALSIWRGFIVQDVPYRGGSRTMPGSTRHLTGSDAVLAGGLGVLAGAVVMVLCIVTLRTSPPDKLYDD
jgi:hypothetical protein